MRRPETAEEREKRQRLQWPFQDCPPEPPDDGPDPDYGFDDEAAE